MTTTLSDRIAKVFELDAERTILTWHHYQQKQPQANYVKDWDGRTVCGVRYRNGEADAAFIATSTGMSSIIRELLAVIEKQREALEGVVRVADRKTIEFDAAREALSLSEQLVGIV